MYSIIMPVYNGRNYFEESLKSAIKSISSEDEIIVIEDGSTDGGVEDIVKKHNHNSCIKYFYQSNKGVAAALNFGLEKSEKKIFSWLSHDDLYLPNRFIMDRALRTVSANIITVSNIYTFDQQVDSIRLVSSIQKIGSRQIVRLLGSRFIHGNSLCAPIVLLKSFGGFDERLKHTQDYDLWCKLLANFELVAIPEPTVISRLHSNQHSKVEPLEARREYKNLLLKYLSLKDLCEIRNFFELVKIVKNICG